MSAIAIAILVILIIAALLVIALVLLQEEGGEGLGGIFGGGGDQQIGSRKGTMITHITSILATIFIVSSLSLGWLLRTSDVDNVEQAAEALQVDGESVLEWWQNTEESDNEQSAGVISEENNFLQDLLDQDADESEIVEELLKQAEAEGEENELLRELLQEQRDN